MLTFTAAASLDENIGGNYQFTDIVNHIVPIHTHDYYEIFLITKGSVRHEINKTVEHLPTGSLVFVRPDDVHMLTHYKCDECQMINIIFSQATFDKIICYYEHALPFDNIIAPPFPPKIQLSYFDTMLIASKLDELNLLYHSDKKILRAKLLFLLNEIIAGYFFDGYINHTETHSSHPQWFAQLCNEMKKPPNFSAGISRMEIISQKSKAHISRSFSKYLDTTPTEYVNVLRINYAANMLKNSNLPILDIAMMCGYSNLSHFYHLFKKTFNVSPSAYRKE